MESAQINRDETEQKEINFIIIIKININITGRNEAMADCLQEMNERELCKEKRTWQMKIDVV